MKIKVLFMLIIFLSCSPKRYEPYYFLLYPYLREGFQQPPKVTNIKYEFRPDLLSIQLNWDIAIDPDTQQPVQYYFIYLYYVPPTKDEYYDKKYLYDITNQNSYILFTGTFTGKLYILITAYDWGGESPISDMIEVTIP